MTPFQAFSIFVPCLCAVLAVLLIVFGLVFRDDQAVKFVGFAGIATTSAMAAYSLVMDARPQTLMYFLAMLAFVAASLHLLRYISKREGRVPDSAVVPHWSNGGPGTE